VRSRLILTTLAFAVVALATLAPSASATHISDGQLTAQLRNAKQQLRLARERAQKAGADLAARLLADSVVSNEEIAALQTRISRANKLVHRGTFKVRRLAKRVHRRRQIATWARRHDWRPLIEISGREYGVDPGDLYRMMMLESGGQPTVGTTYKGLFQYAPSQWVRHWNPWRHESIFNGWAQIRATALALSKGMGPSQWPNTYPMAF